MTFYPIPDQNRLTEFPTLSHNKEIDVFFPGEKHSNNNFITIGFIEVINKEEEPFEALMERLKKRAQDQGIDALIMLDNEQVKAIKRNKKLLENIFDYAAKADTALINNAEILTGLGIKYKEDIDYLSDYIKSKDIYINTSSRVSYKLNGTIFIDFNGNETRRITKRRQGMEHYEKYIKPYSYHFLVLERSDYWSYKNNFRGDVVKRVLLNEDGFPALRCTFQYGENGKIEIIYMKNLLSFGTKQEAIELFYNERDILIEKNILTKNKEELREYFIYDGAGKLIESELFKVKGRREVPFIKLIYNYYTEEDIKFF